MDLDVIRESLPFYLQGLWTTIWLVAASLLIGLAPGRAAGHPAHLAQPARWLAGLGSTPTSSAARRSSSSSS